MTQTHTKHTEATEQHNKKFKKNAKISKKKIFDKKMGGRTNKANYKNKTSEL